MTGQGKAHVGVAAGLGLWLAATGAAGPAVAQTALDPVEVEAQAAAILDHLGVFWQDIEVTRQAAGLTATVLDTGFALTPDGSRRLELGEITVNLEPRDDGDVHFKLSLGTPLGQITGRAGLQIATITAGRTQISGLWSADIRRIAEATLAINDLVAVGGLGLGEVTVDHLTVALTTPVGEPGPFAFDIVTGPIAVQAVGRDDWSAEAIEIGLSADGFDSAIDTAFRRDFGTSPLGLPDASILSTDEEEEPRRLLVRMAEDLTQLTDGLELRFGVTGLISEEFGGQPVGRIAASLRIDDMRQAINRIGLTFDVSGIQLARMPHENPAPPQAEPLVAHDMSLVMRWHDAPLGALLSTTATTFSGGPRDPLTAGGLVAVQSMLLLARSDLHVELERFDYIAERLRIHVQGDTRIDPGSAWGSVSSFDFTVFGLDALPEEARQMGATQEDLGILQALIDIGEVGDPEDGLSRHDYTLFVDRDGAIGINDFDLRPFVWSGDELLPPFLP